MMEIYEGHQKSGLRFYYSESKEPIAGFEYQDSYLIKVYEGEIKFAELTYGNRHDIRDTSSQPRWDTVEEVLYAFMNKNLDDFAQIVEKLDKASIGYSIAKKIVNREKENIEKKLNILDSLLK